MASSKACFEHDLFSDAYLALLAGAAPAYPISLTIVQLEDAYMISWIWSWMCFQNCRIRNPQCSRWNWQCDTRDDDDVSFYNSTASTWTLATPRTTRESPIHDKLSKLSSIPNYRNIAVHLKHHCGYQFISNAPFPRDVQIAKQGYTYKIHN